MPHTLVPLASGQLRNRFPDTLLPQRSVRAVSMKRRIRGHRVCAVFVVDPICK